MRYKVFRDFDIQTDHQILARRPDLVLRKKKNLWTNFSTPADSNENEKKQTVQEIFGPW